MVTAQHRQLLVMKTGNFSIAWENGAWPPVAVLATALVREVVELSQNCPFGFYGISELNRKFGFATLPKPVLSRRFCGMAWTPRIRHRHCLRTTGIELSG